MNTPSPKLTFLRNSNWKVHRCKPTQDPYASPYHCLLRTSEDDGCCLVLQRGQADTTMQELRGQRIWLLQLLARYLIETLGECGASSLSSSVRRGPPFSITLLVHFRRGCWHKVHFLSLPHSHTLPISENNSSRKGTFLPFSYFILIICSSQRLNRRQGLRDDKQIKATSFGNREVSVQNWKARK